MRFAKEKARKTAMSVRRVKYYPIFYLSEICSIYRMTNFNEFLHVCFFSRFAPCPSKAREKEAKKTSRTIVSREKFAIM